MNFYCKCGFLFHDNADCLYFKGRLIADQDWNNLWNYIDNGVKNGENPCDNIWKLFPRSMFQCPECGRLYMEDDNGMTFTVFTPNGDAEPNPGTDKRMMESFSEKSWGGILYAEWYDDPPVWIKHKGMIRPDLTYVERKRLEYDDYDAFRACFDELFETLRKEDRIRSAKLRINGKQEFSWYRNQ